MKMACFRSIIILLSLTAFFGGGNAHAQSSDSLRIVSSADSLAQAKKTEFKSSRNPKIAVRRSLLLPGWGQAYNHRYWKIPIIYAGFAATTFVIIDQNSQFVRYRDAVKCRSYGTCLDEFPDEDINTLISNREYYRRNRDLAVVVTGLWYALQAVEAYIDAHMMGFDVSDDLSLHWSPLMMVGGPGSIGISSGLTLKLSIP
jgi:hypothetical protein